MFLFNFLIFLTKFLLLILPALISVAFITLMERKILGLIGLRLGPNKTSFLGILQPISDAVKLAGKQINTLSNSSYIFYYLSSGLMLFSSLLIWSALMLDPCLISWKLSIIIVLLCLGFNSFNSIISGWSTFSKYSLIGTIRTVSQLISYEAVLYVILFFSLFNFMSYSFNSWMFLMSFNLVFFIPLIFYIWIPTSLAELNRTPYDFSEGESELVSGFNTEFGSSSFTLIFLSEYSNILFLSFLTGALFAQQYFYLFFMGMYFFIIWIRSVLPRFRFDKLMALAWKIYIPFVTLLLMSLISWSW